MRSCNVGAGSQTPVSQNVNFNGTNKVLKVFKIIFPFNVEQQLYSAFIPLNIPEQLLPSSLLLAIYNQITYHPVFHIIRK
jgi:hypothetical protein